MVKQLQIMSLITMLCNYRCAHCSSNSSPERKEFIQTNKLLKILEENQGDLRKHLVSGGEPTLHRDIREILNQSQFLGYSTNIVTNGFWINPKNLMQTEKRLESKIPEGVIISCSFDLYHLEQDPEILTRIDVLKKITPGRNTIMIDGAYNGPAQLAEMEKLTQGSQTYFVPMQQVGRAKTLQSLNIYNQDKCPKGVSQGFTITPQGIYYCLRGALNDIEKLKSGNANLNIHKINRQIKNSRLNIGNYHPCDICEKN